VAGWHTRPWEVEEASGAEAALVEMVTAVAVVAVAVALGVGEVHLRVEPVTETDSAEPVTREAGWGAMVLVSAASLLAAWVRGVDVVLEVEGYHHV